jgi:hypothetical protein
MRVETGKQAASGRPSGFAREAASADQAGHDIECRALVVTAPAAVPEKRMLPRQAAFLAQLIATKQQAPQTRERRRAEPSEALAAYRSAAGLIRG